MTRRIDPPGDEVKRTMSVDGQRFLFASKRDHDVDRDTLHRDGTGVTSLTDTQGFEGVL